MPAYDRAFNGHYDYRALGEPLGADVLPDAISACEHILAGTARVDLAHSVTVGRTRVSFNPEGLR